jgi:PAS domain S-box-containing protein
MLRLKFLRFFPINRHGLAAAWGLYASMSTRLIEAFRTGAGPRLLVAFAVFALIIGVLGGLSLRRFSAAKTSFMEVAQKRWGKAELSQEALRYSSLNQRFTMQVFLLEEREEIESLLRQRAKNSLVISDLIRQIDAKVDSPEEKALLEAVRSMRAPYMESYQGALDLLVDGKEPERARRIMVTETVPKLVAYHLAWEKFMGYQTRQVEEAEVKVERVFNSTRRDISILVLAGLVAAFITAVGVGGSITRQERAIHDYAEALSGSQAQLQLQFERMPVGCITWDLAGRVTSWNVAAERIFGYSAKEAIGRHSSFIFPTPQELAKASQSQRVPAPDRARSPGVCENNTREGSILSCKWTSTLLQRPDTTLFGMLSMVEDVSERQRADAALRKANEDLVSASRIAGMAEVATSVLHNVGNVLNSLNISTSLISERLKNSRMNNVSRVANLMREHAANLGAFMTEDSRGRKLPEYIGQLGDYFTAEQSFLLNELQQMRQHVDHIKDVITMQQGYARTSGGAELVQASSLLDDALRLNAVSLSRIGIQVVREYEGQVPDLNVEKHKVLQILVNLVRNARFACEESTAPNPCITARVTRVDGRVRLAVVDNGVGISAENLGKLFSYGFTTRKTGHGFGLHSGMRTAQELGGSLQVHSEGLGKGATFTLELPISTVNVLG